MAVRSTPSSDVSGRAAAFEHQVAFVQRSLRRHGIRAADLDDLTQEVLIVMWRRWDDYDQTRPLRPWLAGIVFKVAHRHRQRLHRELSRTGVDQAEPVPSLEEQVETRRQRALALRALEGLDDERRAVLVLYEMDGLTLDEVARLLELPRTTVFSRLRAARASFARAVRRLGIVEQAAGRAVPDAATLLAAERGGQAPAEGDESSSDRPRRSFLRPWLMGAAALAAAALALAIVALRPRPVTAAAPGVSAASLARGLVGHWRFDETDGDLAADSSGHGNDCLLRRREPGAAWATGKVGGALRLERDGWLECGSSASLARPAVELSAAAWVRLPGGRYGVQTLVARQQAAGTRDDFFFGIFARTPELDELVINSRTWATRVAAPLVGPHGRWIHVAATHARSGATTLFLNGKAVATRWAKRPQEPLQAAKAVLIGGGANGAEPHAVNQLFDGELDELRVYERALAAEEIASLASARAP